MSDIDSDEFDFGPDPPPKLHSTAGLRSIAQIHEDAVLDRHESKGMVKRLQFGYGAPGTMSQQSLWVRRFKEFRSVTLHQDILLPFTTEDILRFFNSMLNKMSLPHGKPGLNVGTFVTATAVLLEYGRFQWRKDEGFDLGEQLGVKLKCWIHDCVQQGTLMRGHWQKKTWIGFTVLSHLVREYVEFHLKQGTRSWDSVVTRCLGVVLVSSLGARAGDVGRAVLYKGTEYMQYRHIQLWIEGDTPSFANLRAQVTLAYNKGHKQAHNAHSTRSIRPLNEAHNTHMCPIAWLLTHALRHSLVEGSTLQQVLDAAFMRSDRTVVWLYPRRPVLAAFRAGNYAILELDKPAGTGQLLQTVKRMCLTGGMLDRGYTHALRLGAARDAAHLPSSVFDGVGMVNGNVRQSLGHTSKAYMSGLTEAYVGDPSVQMCNLRATHAKLNKREPAFAVATGPQLLDVAMDKPTEAEIQAAIDRCPNGLSRRKAIARVRANKLDELRETADRRQHGYVVVRLMQPSPLPAPSLGQIAHRVPLADVSVNTPRGAPTAAAGDREFYRNVDPNILSEAEKAELAAMSEEDLGNTIDQLPDSAIAQVYGEVLPTDSAADASRETADALQEQAFLDQICRGNANSLLAGTLEHMEEVATSLFCDERSTDTSATTDPVAEWIEAYAKVNVVKDWHFAYLWKKFCKDRIPQGEAFSEIFGVTCTTGGSREAPRPFMSRCQKVAGCLFTDANPLVVADHSAKCTSETAERLTSAVNILATSDGLQTLHCPYDGCKFDVSPTARDQAGCLRSHIDKTHEFHSRPCEHGCEPEREYGDYSSYHYHLKTKHSSDWPRACSVADCKNTTSFTSRPGLRYHLEVFHKFVGLEIEAHMPAKNDKEVWVEQKCLKADCTQVHTTRKAATKHLAKSHRMGMPAAKKLIEEHALFETVQHKSIVRATPAQHALVVRRALAYAPAEVLEDLPHVSHALTAASDNALQMSPAPVTQTKPREKGKPWRMQQCTYQPCTTMLTDRSFAITHLEHVHRLTTVEAEAVCQDLHGGPLNIRKRKRGTTPTAAKSATALRSTSD